MNANRLFFILIFLFNNLIIWGQNNDWINYTGVNTVSDIKCVDDYVWFATDGGLVKLNYIDNTLEYFIKSNSSLPGNKISDLGYNENMNELWLASASSGWKGICKKENENFISIDHPIPTIALNAVIAVDKEEIIWFGSLYYIAKFDNNEWNLYETTEFMHLPNVLINDIEPDNKGNAWIGALWGLGKYTGEALTMFTDVYGVNALSLRNDTVWMASQNQGLVCFTNEKFLFFDISNSEIPTNRINDLKFDSKGTLWLATDSGLVSYDGVNFEMYNSKNSELPDDFVFTLDIDVNDNIWMGFLHSTIAKFDRINWHIIDINRYSKFSNVIINFAIDSFGNKWISSDKREKNIDWSNYLLKFDDPNWVIKDDSSLQLNFSIIYSDNERTIWRGQGIILEKDNTSWYVYNTANNHKSAKLQLDSKGNIWKVYKDRLKKFDGTEWSEYLLDDITWQISEISIDSNDIILAGVNKHDEKGKLLKFDGNNWEFIYQTILYDCQITALEIDNNGIIWFGTHSSLAEEDNFGEGIIKYDGYEFICYNVDNSILPTNGISELSFDYNGNLWIGTFWKGLVKFGVDNNFFIFNSSNSALPYDLINQIEIDHENNIWVSLNNYGITFIPSDTQPLGNVEKRNNTIFELYPNPAKNKLLFKLNDTILNYCYLQIFNISGEKIFSSKLDLIRKNSIAEYKLSELNIHNSGMYIIHIIINGEAFSEKILVIK